jgi:hypothetical protein
MTDVADLPAGALVVDGDEDPENQNPAVVVNTPPIPATEWDVDDDTTVSEYPGNEPYPDSAPVVLVVYRDELAEWRPEFDGGKQIPAADLARGPCYGYAFPAPRLEAVGHLDDEADTDDTGEGDTDDTDEGDTDDTDEGDDSHDSHDSHNTGDADTADTGDPALAAIADALRESRVDEVRVREHAGVVEAEKFSTTYHVSADGTVREDRGLAERIERTARDAVADAEVLEQ